MNILLFLTYDCDLACSYCRIKERRTHPTVMPWDVAVRALEMAAAKIAKRGCDKATLGFFGGEPLMEWDTIVEATRYFERCLREIRGGGPDGRVALEKTLTTNTLHLNEGKANWLKKNGFYMGLSIDGDQKMHDSCRRFPNGAPSHSRCIETLRFFPDPGSAEIIVTVSPDNVAFLADSIEWLVKNMGARNIAVNPVRDDPAGLAPEYAAKFAESYSRLGDIYIDLFRRGEYLRLDLIDSKITAHLHPGCLESAKCRFGDGEIAVAPNGKIYPCEQMVGNDDFLMGDVFDGVSSSAMKRIDDFKRRLSETPACSVCPVSDRCAKWCVCARIALDVETDSGINPVFCLHEKTAMETADRVANTLYSEGNPLFMAKFYGGT